MDGLASGQHLDELLDAPGSGLGLLGASNAIENGVPIRTGERPKHRLSPRIGVQGLRQVFWNVHAGWPGVGGIPPTVCLGPPDLVFARSMHSAGGTQPLGDGDVPLRPRAPSVSGCESSPERCAVTTSELPVDPAKADRLIECLVVGERCRVRRAPLGQNEPYALRLGVVSPQPGPPLRGISDQELGKIHSLTVFRVPQCPSVPSLGDTPNPEPACPEWDSNPHALSDSGF